MGIRFWIKRKMAEEAEEAELAERGGTPAAAPPPPTSSGAQREAPSGDTPPRPSLLNAIFGKQPPPTPHALGEYDARTYPGELRELLVRRQEVSEALMELDLATREGRIAAIPRLTELLKHYPHPVVYEALINGYIDAGRWDEARGVAFAARERRWECRHSPHLEICLETERLREWSPEEVDALRAEREGTPAPL